MNDQVTPTAKALVPGAGIEPARLAASDFKSDASTNFATRARSAFYPTVIWQVTCCNAGDTRAAGEVKGLLGYNLCS